MNPFNTFQLVVEEIAWASNCVVRGITMKRKGAGWTITIKVTTPAGKYLVAFVDSPTLDEGWLYVYECLHKTSVHLKWYEDKFAS